MSYVTQMIGNESGIQYQGVQDTTNIVPANNMTNMLMLVENIPRGRLDIPMSVTSENVKKILGVEKDNLYLQAVEDALNTRIPRVEVMRVVSNPIDIIDTSWDIEYILNGAPVRALTGDPVPFQYMNGSSATALTVNRTITNLSHQAFMSWSNATVLNLPNTLVFMGQYCFMDWYNLLEIIIPDSVVTIFGSAFQGARSATKIVFGASLETVGAYSFLDMWKCKEIHFRSQVPPSIHGSTFSGLPADIKYYIPTGTRAAYKSANLMFVDDSRIFEIEV